MPTLRHELETLLSHFIVQHELDIIKENFRAVERGVQERRPKEVIEPQFEQAVQDGFDRYRKLQDLNLIKMYHPGLERCVPKSIRAAFWARLTEAQRDAIFG